MNDEDVALIGQVPAALADLFPNAPRWEDSDPRAPGEVARRAEFVFVFATLSENVSDLVEGRGLGMMLQGGACVVGGALDDIGEAKRLALVLDAAGLDFLDFTPLGDRQVAGGDRDTFNLLRPTLKEAGPLFYAGPAGSSVVSRVAEERLTKGDDMAEVFAWAESQGAFPQAVRNVLKAGPLSSREFDEEADRLTRRP